MVLSLGQNTSDWKASGSMPRSDWKNLVGEQMSNSHPSFEKKLEKPQSRELRPHLLKESSLMATERGELCLH